MVDMFKMAGRLLARKVVLWIGGLLGLSGGLLLFGVIMFIILLSALIAGVVDDQKEKESSYSGNGMHTCSPEGELDQDSYYGIFDSESRSGSLSGHGDTIIELAEEKGIDPVLFGAIALHETAWGTSNAIVNRNNPGGLMSPSCNWQCLQSFSSLEDGLSAMAQTLYNRIIVDGLVTVEKLGNVYAPVGATNDPNNLNSNWIPTTNEIAGKLGGLTMNCEVISEYAFDFDGDVSDLQKGLVEKGSSWIGKPYVWGGGRSEASAKRGEFDCSSFVYWVYRQNGISLGNIGSNSTETLKHVGKKVSINDIKVGDLIFWDTYKVDGHVGIYIGDGKFIGSQSSTGVAIENLNSSYWSGVFKGHVRRVVDE